MYSNAGKYDLAVTCPKCNSKKILFAAQWLSDDCVVETLTGKEIPTDVYDPQMVLNMLICETCINYFPAPKSDKPGIQRYLEQIALESKNRYQRRMTAGEI